LLGDPEENSMMVSKRKAHLSMKTRQKSAVSAFSLVSLELTAYPPEFYSLREGSNSGGWKDWKV